MTTLPSRKRSCTSAWPSTSTTSSPTLGPSTTSRPRRRSRAAMVETSRLGRIATWCYDRRRRVVTVWVLVLIAVSVAGRAGGSDFKDKLLGGDTESEHARTLLARSFPTQAGDVAQVVFRADAASGAAGAQVTIDATVTELRGVSHVAAVRGP